MVELAEFLMARLDEDERSNSAEGSPWSSGRCDDETGLHLDYDRARREIEAKRRMLTELLELARDADGAIFGEWSHHQGLEDLLLSALALPYSDHPDYREEWKP